mmetsp:Transcript_26780/g.83881  ORF Transcript_26780/g.83881 Transcript_26780/m.83881 type:complete len:203 (-) Transcript_26780:866-1474(-)
MLGRNHALDSSQPAASRLSSSATARRDGHSAAPARRQPSSAASASAFRAALPPVAVVSSSACDAASWHALRRRARPGLGVKLGVGLGLPRHATARRSSAVVSRCAAAERTCASNAASSGVTGAAASAAQRAQSQVKAKASRSSRRRSSTVVMRSAMYDMVTSSPLHSTGTAARSSSLGRGPAGVCSMLVDATTLGAQAWFTA